ncbi:PaaX family transcriptional regulator C-terminal domain-containing protein [Nonomuraea sp. NPDC049152]|uniref:PaaX family transcriptional regulator C-terminal domain-containing protein n=1 Tax=Nonomuraea sp. NPDC049152 TaxID=3154350 RepID=UPI00340DEA33
MNIEVPTRVLVEALISEDGTVDAAELYDVAALLGMSDQQVRLCVKRLVAEGRFTHEGRGRKAVLRATARTERSLAPDVAFVRHAYQQDAGLAPWDGTWHLVAFAVPERSRQARDALRETLGRLGGAALQGGLYVSANAWEPYVEEAARELGVLDHLTFATTAMLRRGEEADPVALARALWPQEELAARYHHLLDVIRPRLDRLTAANPLAPEQVVVIAIELATAFTHAMEPDPLLPPELLPQPWPGAQARELFARCWSLLRAHPGHLRLFALYD